MGSRREVQGTAKDAEAARSAPKFIHLHTHSAYSLLEGALPLKKLVELAVADGQPALAVTDRNNLFGALEFSEAAAGKGLQPIMGIKLAIDFGTLYPEAERARGNLAEPMPSLVLLAMNEAGYGNLVRLSSRAFLGDISELPGDDAPPSQDGDPAAGVTPLPGASQHHALTGPHVTLETLSRHAEGVICLTGAGEGPVNRLLERGETAAARALLQHLAGIFGDRLYVELQRHGSRDDPREERSEPHLLKLAYETELPLVATNQPFFAVREDFEAHDALRCIAEGVVVAAGDRMRLTPEHYFKSADEMAALFADLPEALENTVEIALRCAYRAPKRQPILPRFAQSSSDDGGARGDIQADAQVKAEAELLRRQAEEGLKERFEIFEPAPGFSREDYDKRLAHELSIIEQMGFPGYFLIVADFIGWAKSKDIPVGPGRGSGAGSLVAWALLITDIDPMRFSLLFERFLNPERVSMPDFDIDFCQERREEVIRYVQEKYGSDQVAQIITFGTLQARAVLRDVGRVLQMPYGQVDRIAKLVPANPANPVTLRQAIDSEPKLQEAASDEEIVARLFDIAMRLEGLYRHASTHAAGIVIGDRRLDELVPLYRDPRSDMPVTQFNMKWVEQAGLVKFDFLGLKTLTVLEKAVEFVAQRGDAKINLLEVPLDDRETYAMLTRGETVGIFQLESAGMRKALLGMKPDRFEDIIALVALYRPGPMENIPVYNARKNGEEQIASIHPKIDHLVAETQGVIVYQEQVMQIAQELAGYSLGEADVLRRAMGKKIRSEMDKQRDVFVKGATERDITKSQANQIFDLLAKFADYGFNKSHAAAYALVSYHTAYMKAHYPVEFLAASMQFDMGNTDKLAVFRQEARDLGIEVVPPSVQTCNAQFSVRDGKIYYALAAIKGVGEAAVEHIVREREENGPFSSLGDLFSRIDVRLVNKRTVESLICAGAFDCFDVRREQMLAGIDRLTAHAQRIAQDRATGQNDMFGALPGNREAIELPATKPWMQAEKLQRELQAMGFYLSAHPLDEYRELMLKSRIQLYSEFEESVRAGASAGRLAGTVTARQERKTRTGRRMGVVMLSDPSGQYEALLFDEGLSKYRDLLEPGQSVILLVNADIREEGISLRVQSVQSLEAEAMRESRNLRIFLRDDRAVASIRSLLTGSSAPPRGDGSVSLVVIDGNGEMEVEMQLPARLKLSPQHANAIKSVQGVLQVEMV